MCIIYRNGYLFRKVKDMVEADNVIKRLLKVEPRAKFSVLRMI